MIFLHKRMNNIELDSRWFITCCVSVSVWCTIFIIYINVTYYIYQVHHPILFSFFFHVRNWTERNTSTRSSRIHVITSVIFVAYGFCGLCQCGWKIQNKTETKQNIQLSQKREKENKTAHVFRINFLFLFLHTKRQRAWLTSWVLQFYISDRDIYLYHSLVKMMGWFFLTFLIFVYEMVQIEIYIGNYIAFFWEFRGYMWHW